MTKARENNHTAEVAHDIRQMLMTIMGRSALLLRKDLSPAITKDLQTIELAATDAAQMLKRLTVSADQAFSDLDARGDGALLVEVVGQSLDLISPPDGQAWQSDGDAIGDGPWSVTIDIKADRRVSVPDQVLREVVNNLLTNALAVMPEGGRMHFSARDQGDRLQLVVQDSGPGVPADLVHEVFEPHFSTSGQDGRGLGLPGSRALLRQFDAELELDGNTGGGASFVLDLPLAQGEPAMDQEAESGSIVPGKGQSPVLVVDDELSVREMLADVLAELECPVTAVSGADEALQVFAKGRFAAALIDRRLPGVSGLELASLLRARDPHLVLVLVTGWGNDDIETTATNHGFDISAEKPLTVGKIRQVLEQSTHLYSQRVTGKEES